MGENFPLLLPAEAAAIALPWDHENVQTGGGPVDRGWLVEAATRREASVTWCFGKVRCSKKFPNKIEIGILVPPVSPSHAIFDMACCSQS